MKRSIGGIIVGNGWLRNNPDLLYPEGHESMDDETLKKALGVNPTVSEEVTSMKTFKPRPLSTLRVKAFTLYKVQVSFNPNNPFFTCLLLVGFTHCNRPAGYSKLVGTDIDEIDYGFSDIQCRAMEEVCSINFDDYGV